MSNAIPPGGGEAGMMNITTVSNILSVPNYNLYETLKNSITDPAYPRAYLNYLVFNESMQLIPEESQVIQLKGAPGNWQFMNIPQVRDVNVNGYVLTYFSNESCIEVAVDNMEVIQYHGRLQQEQMYYPHGLVVEGGTSTLSLKNRYLFEGNEKQDELGLELYDFHARQYDQQVGRFTAIDPLADEFGQDILSPYHFVGNDVANYTDPMGLWGGRYGQPLIGATQSYNKSNGGRGREVWRSIFDRLSEIGSTESSIWFYECPSPFSISEMIIPPSGPSMAGSGGGLVPGQGDYKIAKNFKDAKIAQLVSASEKVKNGVSGGVGAIRPSSDNLWKQMNATFTGRMVYTPANGVYTTLQQITANFTGNSGIGNLDGSGYESFGPTGEHERISHFADAAMIFVPVGGVTAVKAEIAMARTELAAVEKVVHGNSLKSLRPTWGYKLYSQEGTFLKNGITSKTIPQSRYTRSFMKDKYMVPEQLFPNRKSAWEWEFKQNQILRGPLNKNMH